MWLALLAAVHPAPLTATQAAFFTAVATIIPVFVVAYAVGLRTTFNRLARRPQAGWSVNPGSLLVFVEIVAVVAIAFPCIGEWEALHALYVDHASASVRRGAFLGAVGTAAVVIVPLAYAALSFVWFLPVAIAQGDGEDSQPPKAPGR